MPMHCLGPSYVPAYMLPDGNTRSVVPYSKYVMLHDFEWDADLCVCRKCLHAVCCIHVFAKRTCSLYKLQAAMYGMSQTIPDRSIVEDLVMEYVDALYNTNYQPVASSHQVMNGQKHNKM